MRLMHEVPAGRGNYPVVTARSQHMRQWDDWHRDWLAKRDRKPLPRPAIDVDDYADLVEEVQV